MMNLDMNSEFGQRVMRRLAEEQIIWLTTVSKKGIPQPRPIWFWWDGKTILMYSQPNTYKLSHIKRSPDVALNFDGNDQGGDIIVINGQAAVDSAVPPANKLPEFVEKYAEGIKRIGLTPQSFADKYSVAIRVVPGQVRGH